MLTIQFLCPLPNGLHARPAWELKEQCSQWQSEVTFINHRQNAKADAKSSLALIGTGTLFNDSCSLNISGKPLSTGIAEARARISVYEVRPVFSRIMPAR